MFKHSNPGIRSRQHKDGRIEWTASVYRAGKRWVSKGFPTKQAALLGRQRLIVEIDSQQLSWVTPRLLTVQEASALLSHAPLWLVGPILMSLLTGLRVSEIVALRPTDIDFDRESLNVAGVHGGQAREFPLPTLLTTLFWLWQKTFPAAPSMFVDGSGKPLTQAAMAHAFRKTCTAAGLTDLRLQDLRHTFAAWALQANLPCGVIAVMMGARRSTAAWFAHYLHSMDQWTARSDGRLAPNPFHELSRLIVSQPAAYAPFLVALFAAPSPELRSAA